MKRIYLIRNGIFIFSIFIILTILSALIGLVLLFYSKATIEAVGFFVCCLLYICILVILKYKHYISCVTVNGEGIKIKKRFLKWNDIFITVDYSAPNQHMRNSYVYQFFFGTEFLLEKSQRQNKKREGWFIDVNVKIVNLIRQYYKKDFFIVSESPLQSDILGMLKEHNDIVSSLVNKHPSEKKPN